MSDFPLIPAQSASVWTIRSLLERLSVVTWAIPPERLDGLVPAPLSADTVEIDGARRALVSAVTFRNRDFRPVWFPLPGLSLGQTNYRVYVRCPAAAGAERGVFFLGTTIDTAATFVPRSLWSMPWRRARYRFGPERVEASGEWPMRLRLTGLRAGSPTLPGFSDEDAALGVLTQPWVGFYARSGGGLGRYTIWHEPYTRHTATLAEAHFPMLDALGVVPLAEQQAPHSVLVEPQVRYNVYLPPRRWSLQ